MTSHFFSGGGNNVNCSPLFRCPLSRSEKGSLKRLKTLLELSALVMVNNEPMLTVNLNARIEEA